MRVAIIVLEDFPGGENRVQRQASALLAAGHEVRVFAPSGLSSGSDWNGVRIERSRVRRLKRSSTRQRLWEYVAFPAAAGLWCRRLRSWRPDLIQVANPPDWLVFSALGAGSRPAVVLDIHDVMPELAEARGDGPCMIRALRWIEGRAIRYADASITTTRHMQRALLERHGVHVDLCLNAVDDSLFTRRPPSGDSLRMTPLSIVYHGTVSARFGVGVAVNAMALLMARGAVVTLDVFGDGDALEELTELAHTHGIDEVVRFHGQVPSATLPDLLADAAIGVIPYIDSPFMRTAYSTKAFEYASLGIPVVASDLPTLRDQLGDDGALYFTPGSAAALADGIQSAAAHVTESVHRAGRAQRHLGEFVWADHSGEYVALLQRIAEQKTAG